MKTLYLENFKGFSKILLPILDVNFFVGENSTGKTAIINLLNILSKPSFWFDPNFNDDDVELGYFDEIARKGQSSKKYFKIGVEFTVKAGSKDLTKFIILKFEDKDSVPVITEFKMLIGNTTIVTNLAEKKIVSYAYDNSCDNFKEWIDEDKPKEKKYLNIEKDNFLKHLPFGIFKSFIISKYKNDDVNIDKTNIGFSIKAVFRGNYLSFAPIRAKAKRTYDSYKQSFTPEGEHMPSILRKLFNNNSSKNEEIISALQHFGKESALFDEIRISQLGNSKVSPFEIEVLYDKTPIKIINVGYGISQILPILIEILISKNDVFSIQQPEVHLHPKAQAAFGQLIYNSVIKSNNKFIIETHSDYMINRYRFQLSKSKSKKTPKNQVVFFEREKEGTKLTCLELNSKGQYPEDLPDAYMSFFFDEELKMLEI